MVTKYHCVGSIFRLCKALLATFVWPSQTETHWRRKAFFKRFIFGRWFLYLHIAFLCVWRYKWIKNKTFCRDQGCVILTSIATACFTNQNKFYTLSPLSQIQNILKLLLGLNRQGFNSSDLFVFGKIWKVNSSESWRLI